MPRPDSKLLGPADDEVDIVVAIAENGLRQLR